MKTDQRVAQSRRLVVAVVVVAVAVFLLVRAGHHDTGGSSDVNVAACVHGRSGTGADVAALNTATKPAWYYFTVNFVDRGAVLDRQTGVIGAVAPGASGGVTVTSGRIGAGVECHLTKVSRDTSTP